MILFLMLLCTSYCVYGMEETIKGEIDLKQGIFKVTGYDTIYSNHATDDGKGGSNISYSGAPLCLIGQFVYTDKSEKPEELMIPIEAYRNAESEASLLKYTSDGTAVLFRAYKTRKNVSLVMSNALRKKVKEALGK